MKAILAIICMVLAVFTAASPIAVSDAVDFPEGHAPCQWKDPHCKDWDWKECKCNDKHDSGTITVQLANDQSGANANQNIQADGKWRSIGDVWKETDIYEHGKVMVSSAMLTKFRQQTVCAIKDTHIHVELNARRTWMFLAGGAVNNLANGWIKCWD